jgi:hypothetical protein
MTERNDPEQAISDEAREDRAKAEEEVAERHAGEEPHHELSNPATDPDPTEFPDPYERRADPRDPATVDTPADPADPEAAAEHDPAPADPSTSDPPPPRNLDRMREGEGSEG